MYGQNQLTAKEALCGQVDRGDQRQVFEWNEKLDKSIKELGATLSELTLRIAPILTPGGPQAPSDRCTQADPPRHELCQMADFLRTRFIEVRGLTTATQEILQRVQL